MLPWTSMRSANAIGMMLVLALTGCDDRRGQEKEPSAAVEPGEWVPAKDADVAADTPVEFDTWQFSIGLELPVSALILGDDAWLVTRQLPGPQMWEAEARSVPVRWPHRIYRQRQGTDDDAILVHAWSVTGPVWSDMAGRHDRALLVWRDTVAGASLIAARLIGEEGHRDEPWHLELPRGVDPRGEVLVASRTGASGWVVCTGTFEGRRDDNHIRCAGVVPEAGDVGSWHRLVTEETARPWWLGEIGGALHLIVADREVPAGWVAAVRLEPDGSPAGPPVELARVADDQGGYAGIVPVPGGVLLRGSGPAPALRWDGAEARPTRRAPDGLVSFQHRGVTYLARGGFEGYAGFVTWDEDADERETHHWPPAVHQFLGPKIAHHVLPAPANGVALAGAPADSNRVLVLRPRP
jgi:hypothetical protein